MKISYFSVSVTVAGAFIGAGFASGQELWQFFAQYGYSGALGFILAALGLSALSMLTLYFASRTKSYTLTEIAEISAGKTFAKAVTVYEFVFYISIYVIMTAGVEELVTEYLPIPRLAVGIVFCAAVTFISLVGVNGIMKIFSATVPLLTLLTVLIAIISAIQNGITLPDSFVEESLVSNPLTSALIYISYNFLAGMGVIASLGAVMRSKRMILKSGAFSAVFLAVLGLSIIVSVFASGTHGAEMPMFDTARSINAYLGIFYGVILALAMFGAGISSLFPIAESLNHSLKDKRSVIAVTVAVSCLSTALSLLGFSDLIGAVYPAFGYIGFILIIITVFGFMKAFKKEKKC